ncbi:FtsX-like permease family protein [Spirosoma sp. HMF4905]|uniref:FtsX-like permease family protein n=1 Tax=Spirosoma arboris TaxID=2682092 RepID=A0A7K1SFL9_9BACT|nr:ABC transporter permease [Spirosoma arboris]MVM32543.1 FtsX-like permease family protein [Spirosoma arboris]
MKPPRHVPPRLATRLLHLFCAPHRVDELEDDLDELFRQRIRQVGVREARWRYVKDVLSLMRPSLMKRHLTNEYPEPTHATMIRNYLKIARRNLIKNKTYSFINIGGLAVGMTVAMLIGLWVYDELSVNRSFENYDRIAQVMQNQTNNGIVSTQEHNPPPLGDALRTMYGTDFKYVVMSSGTFETILSVGDKKFTKPGNYIEPDITDMLSLKMLKGTRSGLKDPSSILLSESVAKAFFGDNDPIGKIVKLNDNTNLNVAGVYEDFPANSQFSDVTFLAPWNLIYQATRNKDDWDNNQFRTYVQLADNADMDKVSAQIKDIKFRNGRKDSQQYHSEMFLHPMSKWYLASDFENGVSVGGRIQYVWLFSIIGVFVLLLACINFMNLSTARSEKRAREVGIRKAVGSVRSQLISQFFSESFLVVILAFALAIGLTTLSLTWFNEIAGKHLTMLWTSPYFWAASLGFILLTGFLAGSYPALYLSSFQPIKVLKGIGFQAGRFAALPRKVLVVVQFTVSVTLIIGTIIVYRQIQYAQNRPMGYNRAGLIILQTPTPDVHDHFDAIRDELKKSGAIAEMAESHSPLTNVFLVLPDFDWKGKNPSLQASLGAVKVSYDYGKTVGWQFKQGRDFSRTFTTDSVGMILNESAAKIMGFKHPVGEVIKAGEFLSNESFNVIGVIKDMVMESPYEPVRPSVFIINRRKGNFAILKLAPTLSAADALSKTEAVFKKYNPAAPFDYKFVDQEHAVKFAAEERVGKLALLFTSLAILISCLGLFGLASFMAEQRTKEIGVRKVLGASVFSLWRLLSKDFVFLVVIAFGIATPLAYYLLGNWLQKYSYHTDLSWWIFAASGAGALVITLLTVSYQSIKATLMNPVKSLRSE